jgi:hypothetical protein
MIPSGYKSQKVYSVLPTNGDGDFTFDRNNAGSRVNKNGLIEQVSTDIPRLDYSDGSCPSLLLEPASTNLARYSEDFSQWTKSEINGTSTIISSSQLSPSGTNNAYRVNCVLDDNTLNNEATFRTFFLTGLSVPNRTVSFYLRSDTSSEVMVRRPYNDGTYITFQLTNNWERYSIPLNNVVATTCLIEIGLRAITGFGDTNLNATFDVWGAQLEEKPYATSYIPTTTGSASRGADSSSKDGLSSYISSTAGVLYAELKALSSESTNQRWIYIGDGSIDNFVAIVYMPTSNELVAYGLNGGNSSLYISTTNYNLTDDLKVAIKWKENDSQLYINGSLIDTDTDTQDFNFTFSELRLEGSAANKFYGKVKDLRVYNTALTDLELQELTTI